MRLNHAQRLALLDHELCHVMGDTDTGFTMRDHDIEEFNAVIERHGAWSRDVVEFLATARKAQIELPMDLPPVDSETRTSEQYNPSADVQDLAERLQGMGATVTKGGTLSVPMGDDYPPQRTVDL